MLKLLTCFLIVTVFFSGCGYLKQSLVEVQGKEVNVPLGIGQSIKGKGLKAFLYRQVFVTFPSQDNPKTFKNIKTSASSNNDGYKDSIAITK